MKKVTKRKEITSRVKKSPKWSQKKIPIQTENGQLRPYTSKVWFWWLPKEKWNKIIVVDIFFLLLIFVPISISVALFYIKSYKIQPWFSSNIWHEFYPLFITYKYDYYSSLPIKTSPSAVSSVFKAVIFSSFSSSPRFSSRFKAFVISTEYWIFLLLK